MLDLESLRGVLELIDRHLEGEVRLCLIGSGATILLGQPDRGTEDLDAWARASRFGEAELRRAVEKAGLGFDPRGEFPQAPYLQVIHPGIVQVPGYDPAKGEWFGKEETVAWQGERLTVTTPPPEALIASKLVRGEDRDFEDCLWLMAAKDVGAASILAAVRRLPGEARAKARDHLDILHIMNGNESKGPKR